MGSRKDLLFNMNKNLNFENTKKKNSSVQDFVYLKRSTQSRRQGRHDFDVCMTIEIAARIIVNDWKTITRRKACNFNYILTWVLDEMYAFKLASCVSTENVKIKMYIKKFPRHLGLYRYL